METPSPDRSSKGVMPRILYCHCAYAQVVPVDVKEQVLGGLAASGAAFEAVPDLCEMAARCDPALKPLAAGDGPTTIIACYPRAVRWLFYAAGTPLDPSVRILNMREQSAEEIITAVGPSVSLAPQESS